MGARNILQLFVHLAGQGQASRARVSEEEGSPRRHSTRDQRSSAGDLVVGESDPQGFGLVMATNSLVTVSLALSCLSPLFTYM